MRYLIIGGTGTLGKELIHRLYGNAEIDIFSRDEFKQYQIKKVYPDVRCILGDIRQYSDIDFDYSVYDAVFHTAALKHVDIGENNVDQFIQTNLNGTINVSKKCSSCNTRLVFFSTDKAVLPINAYGMTKALAEKYLMNTNKNAVIFRWGNILGSRGSIISYFTDIIQNGGHVPITHLDMSRFWLTINEVVDFVMENFAKHTDVNSVLIPRVKSATVQQIALAIGKLLDKPVKFTETGIRPGEKIHEHLYSDHDYCVRSDNCEKFTMDDLIIKLRPLIEELT